MDKSRQWENIRIHRCDMMRHWQTDRQKWLCWKIGINGYIEKCWTNLVEDFKLLVIVLLLSQSKRIIWQNSSDSIITSSSTSRTIRCWRALALSRWCRCRWIQISSCWNMGIFKTILSVCVVIIWPEFRKLGQINYLKRYQSIFITSG